MNEISVVSMVCVRKGWEIEGADCRRAEGAAGRHRAALPENSKIFQSQCRGSFRWASENMGMNVIDVRPTRSVKICILGS